MTIRNAFAFATALSALLGCGARSSLLDFASAAGAGASSGTAASASGGASSESSSAAGGTCGDPEKEPANSCACGACNGRCTHGRCLVTLASEQMNVGCIALDASSVYWATADLPAHGAINKIAHDGGPFSTIATTPSAPWPCRMAVDAMFAYWADGSYGTVFKARIRGSVAVTLAVGLAANYLAIDATNAYWTGQFAYPTKISLSGGAPVRVADSYSANGIAIDATSLYWTFRGASNTGGTVQKVPLSGGEPTTLALGQDDPQGIAVDAASVYWANYGSGTIQKASRDGGAITTLASQQTNASVIAIDETSVYWSTGTGLLMKVPKAGGAAATLTESTAFDIAVDAQSVYWTDGSAVLKLTPK